MKAQLLSMLISMVENMLDEETLADLKDKLDALREGLVDDAKEVADDALDWIEDYVEKSENKWDDALLPVLKTVRDVLDIPDNDAPDDV